MMTHIHNVLVDDVPSCDWRVRNVKDIPYLSKAFIDSWFSNNSSWLIVYLRCVSSQMTKACPFFQCISCIFSCKDSRIHDFSISPRPHLSSSCIWQLKENLVMVSELYISSKSNDETSIQDCPHLLFGNRWRDPSLIR